MSLKQLNSYELGRKGYESYCAQAGGVSLVTGAPLPKFASLPPDVRHAWIASACSIAIAVMDHARDLAGREFDRFSTPPR